MKGQHKDTETQPLLDLLEEAKRMVEADQGNTLVSLGRFRVTAAGLVEAGNHFSDPVPPSPWQEFLETSATTINRSFAYALKRISLIAAVLLLLTLLVLGITLASRFNKPHILASPTPMGQLLQLEEIHILEKLNLTIGPNSKAKAVIEHLLEGSCPSIGVWRNNSNSRLLVCFTNTEAPGALKFVEGEFFGGGAFTTQNLRQFVDAHSMVKIYGGD